MTEAESIGPTRAALPRMSPDSKTLTLEGHTATMRFVPAKDKRHTIVFFHGLLGDSNSWTIFDPYDAPWEYADCFHVDFHFEMRRMEPPTFDDIIDESANLMRAYSGLGDEPLTLVGNSFGGHVALHLDAARLARPKNLVLFSPGGIPEVAAHRTTLAAYRSIDKILEVSFERIFNDPSVARQPELQDKIRRYKERIEPYKRIFSRNLLDLGRTIKKKLLTRQDLRRVRAQTLLVWGRRDMITPPNVCDILRDNIPNSRVEWVESGHAPHIECPKDCSRLLRDYCLSVTP